MRKGCSKIQELSAASVSGAHVSLARLFLDDTCSMCQAHESSG